MEERYPSRSRRAAKACTFCRQRKLRCDEKLTRSNCEGYGKNCMYLADPPRPRMYTMCLIKRHRCTNRRAAENTATSSRLCLVSLYPPMEIPDIMDLRVLCLTIRGSAGRTMVSSRMPWCSWSLSANSLWGRLPINGRWRR
ncbi:hypothetical protein AWENTII_013013 [Aspergillus wentii]